MPEIRIDLDYNGREVVKNRFFENGFSFQCADWTPVNWTTGGDQSGNPPDNLVKFIFLNEFYTLDLFSGTASDTQYRRGPRPQISTIGNNGGVSFNGIWISQDGVIESGIQYNAEITIREFIDDSVAHSLPANSSFVRVHLGDGTVAVNANSTGTTTSAGATTATSSTIYIQFYACRAHIESISVTRAGSTSPVTTINPKGWEELQETVAPDEVLRGVFRRFIQGVKFFGEGYTFLKQIYDTYGEDASATATIYTRKDPSEAWASYLDGIVIFDDTTWDEERCQVDVIIEAADSIGILSRNKEAQFNLLGSTTYTGRTVGQLSRINAGGTGVTLDYVGASANDHVAFYLHDLAERAVVFASDNDIAFSSADLGGSAQGYGANGDFSQCIVTSGYHIRDVGTISSPDEYPAYTTFKDVFETLYWNYGLYAKISSGTLTLYNVDGLYDSGNTSVTLSNVPNIERENLDEIRYKTITIGFETYEEEQNNGEPHGQFTWKFSQRNTSGGTQAYLSPFIASPQLIVTKNNQGTSTAQMEEYDDRLFLLELQDHTTYTTKKITGQGPYEFSPANPINNESIYPWRSYGYHAKNIYESATITEIKGNIFNAGVTRFGVMLDFRDATPWFKNNLQYFFKNLYRFEYPLTPTQIDAIVTNPEYKIRFSSGTSNYIDGWIKSIERSIKTGLCTIELIAE